MVAGCPCRETPHGAVNTSQKKEKIYTMREIAHGELGFFVNLKKNTAQHGVMSSYGSL